MNNRPATRWSFVLVGALGAVLCAALAWAVNNRGACYRIDFERPTPDADGWISLFDGKSLYGWVANEHPASWKVENGAIVACGPRSHLYYLADDRPIANFELELEALTRAGSNSGVFFHTHWQRRGWPQQGYEIQINNSHADPQRTGGIYNIAKLSQSPAKDNEWFRLRLIVQNRRVRVEVNGERVVDYKRPATPRDGGRLGAGYIALQAHDPGSVAMFRNLRLRRLP